MHTRRVYIHTRIFKMYTIFNTFYYYLISLRLSYAFQLPLVDDGFPFPILVFFVFLTPIFLAPWRDAGGRGVSTSTLCI